MSHLLGGLIGAVAAGGIVLVVKGVRGTAAVAAGRHLDWSRIRSRAALGVAGLVVGWLATGWPAAGAVVAASAAVVPALIEARRGRAESLARTEALASWAEMLRDTIGSHAGLREAIGVTAEVAPDPIRAAVQRLAARAERDSLSAGLSRFASEVGDPVGDLVVAALVVAADGRAGNLPALLSGIAASARSEAHMRLRVETGRARTYSSSRALVAITLGLSVSLLVFAPEFMAPYSSPWGQLVLVIIAALFASALWGLIALGRPAATPRLLAGVAEGGQELTR